MLTFDVRNACGEALDFILPLAPGRKSLRLRAGGCFGGRKGYEGVLSFAAGPRPSRTACGAALRPDTGTVEHAAIVTSAMRANGRFMQAWVRSVRAHRERLHPEAGARSHCDEGSATPAWRARARTVSSLDVGH
ncbi:MAG: hypothetical protein RL385_2979 [Pseudomonadota bacterium]